MDPWDHVIRGEDPYQFVGRFNPLCTCRRCMEARSRGIQPGAPFDDYGKDELDLFGGGIRPPEQERDFG